MDDCPADVHPGSASSLPFGRARDCRRHQAVQADTAVEAASDADARFVALGLLEVTLGWLLMQRDTCHCWGREMLMGSGAALVVVCRT